MRPVSHYKNKCDACVCGKPSVIWSPDVGHMCEGHYHRYQNPLVWMLRWTPSHEPDPTKPCCVTVADDLRNGFSEEL